LEELGEGRDGADLEAIAAAVQRNIQKLRA
jgi:hypothetical protein